MTPLGHAVIGLLARRAVVELASVDLDARGMLVGSILPDLDFLLLPFGDRKDVHRTYTHSPFFVLCASLLLRHWLPLRAVACGGILHLLNDNFWGGDPPGVAWLFPLDKKRRLIGGELGMGLGDVRKRHQAVLAELAIVLASIALLSKHLWYHTPSQASYR